MAFDANGNLTSDGIRSYSWDGENRLIKIVYPGMNNFTECSYDGLGRNVKIVETESGSVTNTKQHVWCGNKRCEERDGSATLTKRFFGRGQKNGNDNRFYALDRLGSIHQLTDDNIAVQAGYSFGPYGETAKVEGTEESDFQYDGYYMHARSGLDLTRTRAYAATLGRFINRDPIEEAGGINLFGYVANDPIAKTDSTGLAPPCENPCPPGFSGSIVVASIEGYNIWVHCLNGQQTGNGTVSGHGGWTRFSYGIGNGPIGPGAEAAGRLATTQYYNGALTATLIAALVLAGILVGDAAAAKLLADAEKSLQWEMKVSDAVGDLETQVVKAESEKIRRGRDILESIWFKFHR